MTLKEKVEWLNVYHRLTSVAVVSHHFKINESSKRTIVKREKEICDIMTAAIPCTFHEIHFYIIENAAFMWVQDFCNAQPVESIRFKKKQSHHLTTYSKKTEKDLKLENLIPAKNGSIIVELV